jgi:hypothetical protein
VGVSVMTHRYSSYAFVHSATLPTATLPPCRPPLAFPNLPTSLAIPPPFDRGGNLRFVLSKAGGRLPEYLVLKKVIQPMLKVIHVICICLQSPLHHCWFGASYPPLLIWCICTYIDSPVALLSTHKNRHLCLHRPRLPPAILSFPRQDQGLQS